jgi:hypothetical protein
MVGSGERALRPLRRGSKIVARRAKIFPVLAPVILLALGMTSCASQPRAKGKHPTDSSARSAGIACGEHAELVHATFLVQLIRPVSARRPLQVLIGGDGPVQTTPKIRLPSERSGEQIRSRFREKTAEYLACYRELHQLDPSEKGELVQRFRIDRSGSVQNVSTRPPQHFDSPKTVACLERVSRGVRLPASCVDVIVDAFPMQMHSQSTTAHRWEVY